MKAALLGLMFSSALSLFANAAELPLDKSNPTAGEGAASIEKAQWQCYNGYCSSNVCQTPYGACFLPVFIGLGSTCNCNGIIGQAAQE